MFQGFHGNGLHDFREGEKRADENSMAWCKTIVTPGLLEYHLFEKCLWPTRAHRKICSHKLFISIRLG